MEIVRKDRPHLVPFKSLQVGDVFIEYFEGEEYIQMKIPPCISGGGECNAVLLQSGVLYCIASESRVKLVDSTLTIENK